MNEAALYRLASRALFAPFGGLAAIRRRAIDALHVRPGTRVLELGCGPGDVTAQLLQRGAIVEAVDASPTMLRSAASRAPGATFVQADLREYRPTLPFDAVLLLFVLHEMSMPATISLLRGLRDRFPNGGRLVIADHAMPPGLPGRLWHDLLRLIEPPEVRQWLVLKPRSLVEVAGCVVEQDVPLAGGRAHLAAGIAYRPD